MSECKIQPDITIRNYKNVAKNYISVMLDFDQAEFLQVVDNLVFVQAKTNLQVFNFSLVLQHKEILQEPLRHASGDYRRICLVFERKIKIVNR